MGIQIKIEQRSDEERDFQFGETWIVDTGVKERGIAIVVKNEIIIFLENNDVFYLKKEDVGKDDVGVEGSETSFLFPCDVVITAKPKSLMSPDDLDRIVVERLLRIQMIKES